MTLPLPMTLFCIHSYFHLKKPGLIPCWWHNCHVNNKVGTGYFKPQFCESIYFSRAFFPLVPPLALAPPPGAWPPQLTCKVGPPKVGFFGVNLQSWPPSKLAFEVNFGFWPRPSARGGGVSGPFHCPPGGLNFRVTAFHEQIPQILPAYSAPTWLTNW